jgi:hypothetical protein
MAKISNHMVLRVKESNQRILTHGVPQNIARGKHPSDRLSVLWRGLG